MTIAKSTLNELENITFQQLLDYDYPTLKNTFRRLLDLRVNSPQPDTQEYAEELMFLMEGAPELKEYISTIHSQLIKEFEDKTHDIENLIDRHQNNMAQTTRLLNKKNGLHHQLKNKKATLENRLEEISGELDTTSKSIEASENHEKRKLIAEAAEWEKRISLMKDKQEKTMEKWNLARKQLLTLCRSLSIQTLENEQ